MYILTTSNGYDCYNVEQCKDLEEVSFLMPPRAFLDHIDVSVYEVVRELSDDEIKELA